MKNSINPIHHPNTLHLKPIRFPSKFAANRSTSIHVQAKPLQSSVYLLAHKQPPCTPATSLLVPKQPSCTGVSLLLGPSEQPTALQSHDGGYTTYKTTILLTINTNNNDQSNYT